MLMNNKRAFVLVVDSFGIGGAADAHLFGDEGSNTYKAISENIKVPNLIKLGFNNIDGVQNEPKEQNPIGSYARLIEKSMAKDTVTGHLEIMGLETVKPLPTFPNGFPQEIVEKLESAFGVSMLGNEAASGTEIIERLGEESTKSGCPILYTSADSVLQIAANEDVIPVEKLYEMCEKAREIMSGDFAVGRIIARPFRKGMVGYYRTANRKDYSLPPQGKTMLDTLNAKGYEVKGIGKIRDIFSGQGLTEHIESHSNKEGYEKINIELEKDFDGLVFVNLVDTDMLYGHRNDIEGYRKCVERFDEFVGTMIPKLTENDLLVITADHGCDPSTPSTDHSRENVPYISYQKGEKSVNYGTVEGFVFVGNQVEKFLKK